MGIRVYGIGEILIVMGYQRWAKELMHLGNGLSKMGKGADAFR
jgi:hypothetical protein